MLRITFVLIFSVQCLLAAFPADTLYVKTHQRVTITTNPLKGTKSFSRWGTFPDAGTEVRKIILYLTLGTPDSMKTAHWDYCDQVLIRRKGGILADSLNMEIARMLTPYGSMFGKGWQFTWSVDVTDFGPFLRDSVEIEYRHSGYEPDTLGWALTLNFAFIKGPPAARQKGMIRAWDGLYAYGDSSRPFRQQVQPIRFEVPPATGFSRLRIQHTGHGMDEPRGCSEFCSRWRDIRLDTRLVDHRALWKDCGNNPLYPQGGTWIYDRAGWCPGDLQEPCIIDLETKQGVHELTLEMEPYVATKQNNATENITAWLFHYSEPVAETDAAIDHIAVPSDDPAWKRFNPACIHPMIRIRNLGRQPLHSVIIRYGPAGSPPREWMWQGNLPFGQSADVILPGEIDYSKVSGKWDVTLLKPNGRRDAWDGDNHASSRYNAPVMLPAGMVIRFKTNRHPGDNAVVVTNARGDTVFRRIPGAHASDTLFNDTLRLAAGAYQIILSDTAGEGLEFWAEPDQGHGYLRLLDLQGKLLHAFGSDCGNGEMLAFRASESYTRDTTASVSAFSLYPRRIKDYTDLEVVTGRPVKMAVTVTVDGKVVELHTYEKVVSGVFRYYLGYLPKGRIILEVTLDGQSAFKGRLFKEL